MRQGMNDWQEVITKLHDNVTWERFEGLMFPDGRLFQVIDGSHSDTFLELAYTEYKDIWNKIYNDNKVWMRKHLMMFRKWGTFGGVVGTDEIIENGVLRIYRGAIDKDNWEISEKQIESFINLMGLNIVNKEYFERHINKRLLEELRKESGLRNIVK